MKTPKKSTKTTKTTTFTLDMSKGRALAHKHGPIVQVWLDAEYAKLDAEVSANRKVADAQLEAIWGRMYPLLGLDRECDDVKALETARDRCLAKGGPKARKLVELIDAFQRASRVADLAERGYRRQHNQLQAKAHKRLQAAIIAELRGTKAGVLDGAKRGGHAVRSQLGA